MPDTRAERGKTQIVSPASWKLLFDRTEALPATVQHIIVCTTVPVLYPKVGCMLRAGAFQLLADARCRPCRCELLCTLESVLCPKVCCKL